MGGNPIILSFGAWGQESCREGGAQGSPLSQPLGDELGTSIQAASSLIAGQTLGACTYYYQGKAVLLNPLQPEGYVRKGEKLAKAIQLVKPQLCSREQRLRLLLKKETKGSY